jgi:hypothetical protein
MQDFVSPEGRDRPTLRRAWYRHYVEESLYAQWSTTLSIKKIALRLGLSRKLC